MVNEILQGDVLACLRQMPDRVADCCVTSPPYFGLRDYGVSGQIGLEATPKEYVARMVEVMREVRRVIRDDGTMWINIGDSYAVRSNGTVGKSSVGHSAYRETHGLRSRSNSVGGGVKEKDLVGIPWRLAFALQDDGWYLRQDIIWHKPNPMPESVTDRCTKAHEYLFLLAKSAKYYFDSVAIKEKAVGKNHHDLTGMGYKAPGQAPNSGNRKPLRSDVESRHRSKIPGGQSLQAEPDGMRNRRSVWTVTTKPFSGAHFAVFPPELIEPCVLAGSRKGGLVLDPFMGSGTTAGVAVKHGRHYLGCELNESYFDLHKERIRKISEGA